VAALSSDDEMVDVGGEDFEIDAQEMFDFDGQWETEGTPNRSRTNRSDRSGSTSGPETASGSERDRDLDSGYGSSSLASRKLMSHPVNALAFGVSAPPLGFFEPRDFGPSRTEVRPPHQDDGDVPMDL